MKIKEQKVYLRKCIFKERYLYNFLSFLITKGKLLTAFFLSKQYSTTWFPIGNYWWLRQILNLVFRVYLLSYKSVFPIDQFTELQI